MMKRLFFLFFSFTFAVWAGEVSVTAVTAQQRYPWNGLVDIVVTIQGSADDAAAAQYSFAATNGETKAAIPVEHITSNGAAENSGDVWTRKFIWDAKADIGAVKIDDVALSVDASFGVQLWENGPYWAECNVGASQPEESGYYFWWGDTVGYKRNASNNGWISVKDGTGFSFGSGNCPTYGKDNSQLQSAGYIDATGNLVAAHDAATAHLGAPWRMPTDAEFSALIHNCDTESATHNGVDGRLVKGRGAYASKSIFFPFSGEGDGSHVNFYGYLGFYGYYLSSTPNSDYSSSALNLYFDEGGFYGSANIRSGGCVVRPVRGFANATEVVSAGVTTHLALDCREGVRTISSAREYLRYDASWYKGGRSVRLLDNGEVIESGSSCTKHWEQADDQIHCLRMMAVDGDGEQVGSETAYFIRIPSDGAVVIPDVWTEIPAGLFKNCDWLTSVVIPNSMTNIGENAFLGCENLARVDVPSIEDWLSIGFGNEAANPLSMGAKLYVDGKDVMDLMSTLTFNANGGVCSKTMKIFKKGTAIGTLPIAERAGCTFDGWFTAANGGTLVTSATVVADNLLLYAHWTPNAGYAIVTSIEAKQQYPWNGKVDVVMTIRGASNDVALVECTFAAKNSATGTAIPVKHIERNGDDTDSGTNWTRKFIWDAKADAGAVKIEDVALTVEVEEICVQLWENGPYWAKCNVGASKPEEYGYYFRWGDTAGYNADDNVWISVKEGSSFSIDSGICPTDGKNNSQLLSEGYIDYTGNLVAAHDAATAHLGAPWRMPTDYEFSTLVRNCDRDWVSRDDMSGWLVKGRGAYASKSIFIPAAGHLRGSFVDCSGWQGFYWSSTPYPDTYGRSAYDLSSDTVEFFDQTIGVRCNGRSVRPVRGFACASAGVTTHLALDCREGTRTASVGGEELRYDASWFENGTTAKISDNGVLLVSGLSGTYRWTPTECGNHQLKLIVTTSNGSEVGTESASFSLNHDPETTIPVIEPTCTTAGRTAEVKCSWCGVTLETSHSLAALGHDPETTISAIEPTCTTAGWTAEVKCSRCGATLETNHELAALGHDPKTTISAIEPTCTMAGRTAEVKCSRCGVTLATSHSLAASGHAPKTTISVIEPTCTTAGRTAEVKCDRCGATLATSHSLAALGHDPETTIPVIEPTCTTAGRTAEVKCARCGIVLEESRELPGGHIGEITKPAVEPTSGQPGMTAEIKCSRCGEVLQAAEAIPVLGYIRNVTARQLWPHKKVEVCYEVAEDIGEVADENATLVLTCGDWVAKTVLGDVRCVPGLHRVVWDMEADGVKIQGGKVRFEVSTFRPNALGFYKKTFHASSLAFDTTSDIWDGGATIVGRPDEIYANQLAEHTTVAFGTYMLMKGGVTYNFKGLYDDYVAVKINGGWIVGKGAECKEVSGSFNPSVTDLYEVEFRVGNNGGVGGCQSSTQYGIRWNTSVDSTWRLVENLQEEQVFFLDQANLKGALHGDGHNVQGVKTYTYSGYLPTTKTLLWEGISVVDIVGAVGCVCSDWVRNPGDAQAYKLKLNGSVLTAQFQLQDETFVKCVGAEFSDGVDGVYGQAVYSRYRESSGALGSDFDSGSYNSNSPGSSDGWSQGYGVKNVRVSVVAFDEVAFDEMRGVSAPTAINTSSSVKDGMEVAGKMTLVYSPIDAERVTLEINGREVLSATEAGAFEWTPDKPGTYVLTHRAGEIMFTRRVVCPAADDAKELEIGWLDGSIANFFPNVVALLSRVTFAPIVTDVSSGAFSGCERLSRVDVRSLTDWLALSFGDDMSNPLSTGATLYVGGEEITQLVIPEGTAEIGAYAFAGGQFTSVTIPNSVTNIAPTAFAGCSNIVDVTMLLESDMFQGAPGFYEAEFRNMSSYSADNDIVSNARAVVLSADMLTAATAPEHAMYGYAAYMWFEGGVTYEFLAYYDDKASIRLDGNWIIQASSSECRSQTGTARFVNDGWHWIEIRGWNNAGEGAAYGSCSGVKWRRSGEDWRLFADAGDGALFAVESKVSMLRQILPDSYRKVKSVRLVGGGGAVPRYMFANCESLESVSLPQGTTEIRDFAFQGCPFTSVTIPNSVTNIGANAFSGCTSLERVDIPSLSDWLGMRFGNAEANPLHTGAALYAGGEEITDLVIPDGATEIGAYAFAGGQFTSVTIPNCVTNIAPTAFTGCSNIVDITVPSWVNVSSIFAASKDKIARVSLSAQGDVPVSAYRGCTALRRVEVASLDDWLSLRFGNVEANPLHTGATLYVDGEEITALAIPEGTTEIDAYAFVGGQFTSVTIPNSVTNIAPTAFTGCSNIVDVTMGCLNADAADTVGLWQAKFDRNEDWSSPICTAASCARVSGALMGYAKAESSSTRFADPIFGGSYNWNNSNTTFGYWGYMYMLAGRKYVFGKYLDDSAYVKIDGNVILQHSIHNQFASGSCEVDWTGWHEIEVRVADGSGGKGPVGTGNIWGSAMGLGWRDDGGTSAQPESSWKRLMDPGDGSLFRIAMPVTVATIFPDAYEKIRSITLLPGMSALGENLFVGCWGITSLELDCTVADEQLVVKELLPDSFDKLERLILCGEQKRLPDGAFDGCTALSEIELPESLEDFGDNDVREIGRRIGKTGLWIQNGWLLGYIGEAPAEVVVPEGVKGIASFAFADQAGLERVTLPSSLKFVGANAFRACTGLECVELPEGVEHVGEGAFRDCTWVQDVAFPESLRNVGKMAFANCSSLAGIECADGLQTIGEGAFSNCWRMLSVALPASVDEIGPRAFFNCSSLLGVTVPTHVETLSNLFADVYQTIESVVVAEGESELVPGVFSGCQAAEEIVLPEAVREIPDSAFEGCASLRTIEFPSGVVRIGNRAFFGCGRISALTLPPNLQTIGDDAFNGLRQVPGLRCPATVRTIGARAFKGVWDDEEIRLPEGLEALGADAFADCPSIRRIALSAVATSIKSAFPAAYAQIESVTILGAPEVIAPEFCRDVVQLVGVQIPSSVTNIGRAAFAGLSNLAEITLPPNLRTIGEQAFRGDVRLTAVDLPQSLDAVGAGAFEACSNVRAVSCPGELGTLAALFPSAYGQITAASVNKGTTRLMDDLFAGCAKLANVDLPGGVTNVGARAFKDCAVLTAFGVPNGVVTLGEDAFSGCTGLTSLSLPEGLETISAGAFRNCRGISSLVIPSTVTFVGANAFNGCTALKSISYLGSCPAFDADCYSGTPSELVSYVIDGSRGWDGVPTSRVLPQSWPTANGRTITFWEPNTFEATFDGNGGTPSFTVVVQTTGMTYVLPEDDPVMADASFMGWWTQPVNGGEIKPTTKVEVTRAQKFYAHWKYHDYAVRFDANGGEGEMANQGFTVNTPAELSANRFVRRDCRFAGWALSPEGEVAFADGAEVENLSLEQDAVVVLYAVWEDQPWGVADYLNAAGRTFACAGDADWRGDAAVSHDGIGSARSGAIPAADEGRQTTSVLRTTVVGGGTGSFWWKVSCEPDDAGGYCDYCSFTVDGVEIAKIAGETEWAKVGYEVTGDGEHILAWTFARDDWDEDETRFDNAAWVDEFVWTPTPVTLSFDAGGAEGTVPSPITMTAGAEVALPAPALLKKAGMEFVGWTDGARQFAAGEVYRFGAADAVLVAVWRVKVWTLEEAANLTGHVLTTGGDANWTVDLATNYDGVAAIRSGTVGDSQETWVSMSVEGPGTVSFRVLVSGEYNRGKLCDYLTFEVDGTQKYASYDADWGNVEIEVVGAGAHTLKWTYLKNASKSAGCDCAWLDEVEWVVAELPKPTVEGDEEATVTGDAETGFVIKPSEGKTAVEVSIPDGIDAGLVTVEVSSKVGSVKPHGAKVRVVSGATDITGYLDIPGTVGCDDGGVVATQPDGVIDLTKATVKEEIVKEAMDVEKGAVVELLGGSQGTASPTITTAPTKVGLVYTFSEGTTLEGFGTKPPSATKVGDGEKWTPAITVKGGKAVFYSIGVGKGE